MLYNLCWVLSSSDERLMEFYDPLVSSVSMSSLTDYTVLCSILSTCHTEVSIGCCQTWVIIGYCLQVLLLAVHLGKFCGALNLGV